MTKRAYGVKLYRYGKVFHIHARKEVILSAGSVNTPQLLILSGIGPRKHLQELNVSIFGVWVLRITIHSAVYRGSLKKFWDLPRLQKENNRGAPIADDIILGVQSYTARLAVTIKQSGLGFSAMFL